MDDYDNREPALLSQDEPELSAEERDGAIVRGFIPLALRTLSPNYYGSRIPKRAMFVALENVIAAANLLDALKKGMFYGRPITAATWQALGVPAIAEMECFNDIAPTQFKNLLHGIVGKITEAGEAAECLHKALGTGELDTVNLKEEVGDGLWYDAIILDTIGSTFPIEMLRVIDKLRERFPDKYDDGLAINRDHAAERIVLENDTARLPAPPHDPATELVQVSRVALDEARAALRGSIAVLGDCANLSHALHLLDDAAGEERADIAALVAIRGDKPGKQSSPELSSMAAKYMQFDYNAYDKLNKPEQIDGLIADIRSLAASVMSQDETAG